MHESRILSELEHIPEKRTGLHASSRRDRRKHVYRRAHGFGTCVIAVVDNRYSADVVYVLALVGAYERKKSAADHIVGHAELDADRICDKRIVYVMSAERGNLDIGDCFVVVNEIVHNPVFKIAYIDRAVIAEAVVHADEFGFGLDMTAGSEQKRLVGVKHKRTVLFKSADDLQFGCAYVLPRSERGKVRCTDVCYDRNVGTHEL